MNCILLSVAGLRVVDLGCYGNTWTQTPNLDRFADRGFVFDQCYRPDLDSGTGALSWLCGEPGRRPTEPSGRTPLARLLVDRAVESVLVTDASRAASVAVGFGTVIEAGGPAPNATEAVLEAAGRCLERAKPGSSFLLVIDCPVTGGSAGAAAMGQGGGQPVQPPEGKEAQQPSGPQQAGESAVGEQAPALELSQEQRRHAAAVESFDQLWGRWWDRVRRSDGWDECLIAVTGGSTLRASGLPDPAFGSNLVEELGHVPLLLGGAGVTELGGRSQALIYTSDLLPTLAESLGIVPAFDPWAQSLWPLLRFQQRRLRDYLLLRMPNGRWAIRTENWLFRARPGQLPGQPPDDGELFVMPEDRWQRHNVARDYPQVAEQFASLLNQAVAGCGGGAAPPPALPEELAEPR